VIDSKYRNDLHVKKRRIMLKQYVEKRRKMMKIPKNIRIDEKINERLKRHAERMKITETAIIEEAIERLIDIKETEMEFNWGIESTEPICGVYKITNSINGKSYIGKSINIRQRISQHFARTKHNNGYFHTQHFFEDLNKYKRSDFDIEIIEVCKDEADLKVKEEYYIKKYKTYDPEIGYNCFKNKYLVD
jgi:predicted DNA-binding protein